MGKRRKAAKHRLDAGLEFLEPDNRNVRMNPTLGGLGSKGAAAYKASLRLLNLGIGDLQSHPMQRIYDLEHLVIRIGLEKAIFVF